MEEPGGEGVALFSVLIFQFPRARGILALFSPPRRTGWNSSNLASASPPPLPGEHLEETFRVLFLFRG